MDNLGAQKLSNISFIPQIFTLQRILAMSFPTDGALAQYMLDLVVRVRRLGVVQVT